MSQFLGEQCIIHWLTTSAFAIRESSVSVRMVIVNAISYYAHYMHDRC